MLYRAYAKINIGLHVLGKRSDGFHSIATIFAPLELHDELHCEPAPTISVRTQPPLPIAEYDNLVYRAAQLLKYALGTKAGAKITIIKHIPHGSGLGGGSSDAAVALKALLELWQHSLPDNHLSDLALQVGSDVPFFLNPSLSYAEGRGELLRALPPIAQRWVLVVVPPITISTAWAYNRLHRHDEHISPRLLCDALMVSSLSDDFLRSVCTNDFEDIVFPVYPELAEIKNRLHHVGARYVSMTGTGSALYGFFDSKDEALQAATLFPYRTFVTRTLNPT